MNDKSTTARQFGVNSVEIVVRVAFSCAVTAVVAIGAFVLIRYLISS